MVAVSSPPIGTSRWITSETETSGVAGGGGALFSLQATTSAAATTMLGFMVGPFFTNCLPRGRERGHWTSYLRSGHVRRETGAGSGGALGAGAQRRLRGRPPR